MPVKFKKGSKEAKAHMAKIRAMRGLGAGKHTDTKSHNVNIRVVSGNIGSLPFTGKFLGVSISARQYHEGIKIDVGNYSFNFYKGDNIKTLAEDITKVILKKQAKDGDYPENKILQKVKAFVLSLKNEFPKGITKKQSKKVVEYFSIPKKVTTTKSATLTRQTGTSNKTKDEMKKAKTPGKRKSATGKTYYERRANRSDKPGSLLGIKGLKKISGVLPHKAKYYIDYMLNGIERTEYFDKLPKGKYRAENNIYYLLKLTDAGTSLIPILNVKTNQPIKKS